jgi:adenosylmethionine-8-amino-7-oxononanoate aminotransferase
MSQPTQVCYPEGNVLLRKMNGPLPIAVRGEGVYIYDAAGKKYLDGAGGAMVTSVGHGHVDVVRRMSEQLATLAYVNGTQFTNLPTEQLATRLCAHAPQGLDKAFFLSSGSEAVEAALKFVRQYFVEIGQTKRSKVIARTPGYHGNTLFALSASGRPRYKKFFGPFLSEIVMIPTPYRYRSPTPDYGESACAHYVRAFEEAVEREGPDTIAAFLVEPVSGTSTGGGYPPPGYFEKIQQLCKKHGILIVADEVLCGMGRTGKFFACEHQGLKPDALVLGKGLNGGYAPLSAVLFKSELIEALRKGSGNYMHAQTYSQVPCATSAGLAVLEVIERDRLVENSAKTGAYLHELLKKEILPLAGVGHIEGLGLLAGVELVEDKASKKPFDRARGMAEKVAAKAMELGLIIWPNYGQIDGTQGDLVVMGPPLNVNDVEIRELVDKLKRSIQAVMG